jgi:hypothetical protein
MMRSLVVQQLVTEMIDIYPNEDGIVRLIGASCSNRTMNGPSSVPFT